MIPRPFSVVVESMGAPARPVLAVSQDGDLLVPDDEGRLSWVAAEGCRLASLFYDRDEMPTPPWAAELGWGTPAQEHT